MRILTLTIATAAVALSTAAADARPWGANHPRRHEVNARLENQNDRITAGVRDGQLTRTEAHGLRRNDRAIRGEERTAARLDGGHITRAEQRAFNQQENANSRLIATDRHS